MIIGVDRLDYSKGIPERMNAFERFLTLFPDWHGNVTYLQITPHSRSEIPEYADISRTSAKRSGASTAISAKPGHKPCALHQQSP